MSNFFDRGFTSEVKNDEHPIQVGYIFLPQGEDRKEFIRNCRMTNMYSVYMESSTVYHNCVATNLYGGDYDGKSTNYRIPEKAGVLGTRVLCFFTKNSRSPIIAFSIPRGNDNLKSLDSENVDIDNISSEDVTLEIKRDADKKIFNINAISSSEDEVQLNLNVTSKNDKGKFKINVKGEAEIFASKKIKFLSNERIEIELRDHSKSETKVHKLEIDYDNGLTLKDKWDNEIKLKENELEVKMNPRGNVKVEANNVDVKANGKIKIDAKGANSIDIGNAESLALNVNTICQFTGQPHLIPLTNNKTKV